MQPSGSLPEPSVPVVAASETALAEAATVAAPKTDNKTPPYPPISSIPRTPASRLLRASPPDIPDGPVPASSYTRHHHDDDPADAGSTVLYLAYGSNLAAATFLGVRGIRPLSQVNVRVPSLRLTFDLPGFPYTEPCFANVALRKVPKLPPHPPKLPPELPVPPPPTKQQQQPPPFGRDSHGDPVWEGGLIGVVYEVTRDDFAKIIRTEGGGASYQDILVPCLELPPAVSVPEKPPVPELPRPFLVHTLFVPPEIPDGGGDDDHDKKKKQNDSGGNNNNNNEPSPQPPPRRRPWWARFISIRRRPDPERAQPSARYLNLIRDGAREHDLPAAYQAWLGSLACYTITSSRQSAGQLLLQCTAMPLVMPLFVLGALLARKEDGGRNPLWLRVVMGMLMSGVWWAYDHLLKPIFGDGERTEEIEEIGRWGSSSRSWFCRLRRPFGRTGSDEERALLCTKS